MKKIKDKIREMFKGCMFYLTKMHPARVIVLGFALIILFGALLLTLPISSSSGESTNFVDALFTATSAVCVTGLVVVDTGTHWSSFGQTIILLLIQVGGLGFLTVGALFAIIAKKKLNLKERVLIQESLNQFDLSGIVTLVKNVLLITFFVEGIGALLLSMAFIPEMGVIQGLFFGIFHSVSAFCNAGFDLMGGIAGEFSSLTSYVSNPLIVLTISSLIVLGSLGFTVMVDILKRKGFKKLSTHSKIALITTAILILFGFLSIFIIEFNNPDTLGSLNFGGKILASLFQSITTRTAGFNTVDLSLMHEGVIFILIILMFIGASPASTGGGVKTTTIATMFLSVKAFIIGKEDVEIFKRRIDVYTIRKTIGIVFLAICIVTGGTIILCVFEPNFNLLEAGFEAMSAFTTAGLSIVGSGNLTLIGKILIMIFMFMGRVGSLTIFMAFASRNSMRHSHIRYPEDKILVG